jgi:hypothetical protein
MGIFRRKVRNHRFHPSAPGKDWLILLEATTIVPPRISCVLLKRPRRKIVTKTRRLAGEDAFLVVE